MKKYNLNTIMTRAWRIAEKSAVKFGGKASEYINESLRISWLMAKTEILENEKFLLDMKDISGGKTNVFAQSQIAEHNKELNRIEREIKELKSAIYPTITITETFDKLSGEERKAIETRILELETKIEKINSGSYIEYFYGEKTAELLLKRGLIKANPIVNNESILLQCSEMLRNAKDELRCSVQTYTRTMLDINAYDVVA